MGIKNILPFLKEASPEAFVSTMMINFAGYRIAVDAPYLMYVLSSRAKSKLMKSSGLNEELKLDKEEVRKVWVSMLVDQITTFLICGITPVFVFDGKHPAEKDKTKEGRKKVKDERNVKIASLQEKMINCDPLERKANDIKELSNLIKSDLSFCKEDYDLYFDILYNMGIPALRADADGEQLCSMLAIEGKVAAVFSSDSDTLAYGCPTTINKILDNFRGGSPVAECIIISKILEDLKISFETFVDLCIACGCDFNHNMPQVGCKRAYGLLKEFGRLENLPKKYNTEILNIEKCREIFSYKDSETIINMEEYILDIDRSRICKMEGFFKSYEMESKFQRVAMLIGRMTPARNIERKSIYDKEDEGENLEEISVENEETKTPIINNLEKNKIDMSCMKELDEETPTYDNI